MPVPMSDFLSDAGPIILVWRDNREMVFQGKIFPPLSGVRMPNSVLAVEVMHTKCLPN